MTLLHITLVSFGRDECCVRGAIRSICSVILHSVTCIRRCRCDRFFADFPDDE